MWGRWRRLGGGRREGPVAASGGGGCLVERVSAAAQAGAERPVRRVAALAPRGVSAEAAGGEAGGGAKAAPGWAMAAGDTAAGVADLAAGRAGGSRDAASSGSGVWGGPFAGVGWCGTRVAAGGDRLPAPPTLVTMGAPHATGGQLGARLPPPPPPLPNPYPHALPSPLSFHPLTPTPPRSSHQTGPATSLVRPRRPPRVSAPKGGFAAPARHLHSPFRQTVRRKEKVLSSTSPTPDCAGVPSLCSRSQIDCDHFCR